MIWNKPFISAILLTRRNEHHRRRTLVDAPHWVPDCVPRHRQPPRLAIWVLLGGIYGGSGQSRLLLTSYWRRIGHWFCEQAHGSAYLYSGLCAGYVLVASHEITRERPTGCGALVSIVVSPVGRHACGWRGRLLCAVQTKIGRSGWQKLKCYYLLRSEAMLRMRSLRTRRRNWPAIASSMKLSREPTKSKLYRSVQIFSLRPVLDTTSAARAQITEHTP